MKIKLNNLFNANEIEIKDDVSNIDAVLDYEEVLLSISKSIIKYRKENNLTQKELAKILNINQVMISKLERGNYNPTIKLLYGISRTLTQSSDFFIEMLKNIIRNLYKSKNIEYKMYQKKYETYRYRNSKDNITYLVSEYKNDYGGMFYGEISGRKRITVNR